MRNLCRVHGLRTGDSILRWTVGKVADLLLRAQAGRLHLHRSNNPALLSREGAKMKMEQDHSRVDITRVIDRKSQGKVKRKKVISKKREGYI